MARDVRQSRRVNVDDIRVGRNFFDLDGAHEKRAGIRTIKAAIQHFACDREARDGRENRGDGTAGISIELRFHGALQVLPDLDRAKIVPTGLHACASY
jgi:hypothetical protein